MVKLPTWAKKVKDDPIPKIEVDPDKCYPAFFKELGVIKADIDQYWIEVAYQCMKMELQRIMGRFNFEIRVRAHGGRKGRWALANNPDPYLKIDEDGKIIDSGPLRATEGRQAREHYKRLRGFIPG